MAVDWKGFEGWEEGLEGGLEGVPGFGVLHGIILFILGGINIDL